MRTSIAKAALLLLLAGAPLLAAAEIYQCEENGRKVFSQEPCGADARSVTLSGGSLSRITIPEQFDERAAKDVCRVIIGSWDVAARLSKQRVARDQAQQRVFGYLREHIANFDEASKAEPDLFVALKGVSVMVTNMAYTNPDVMPGEQNAAVNQCASKTMESVRKSGGTRKASKTMM